MNQEVNVLALVKGKERYVFLYTGDNREELVESFGRYASDSELSFSWYDAAVMTRKALREKRETELVAARLAMRRSKAALRAKTDPSLFQNIADPFAEDEI